MRYYKLHNRCYTDGQEAPDIAPDSERISKFQKELQSTTTGY